MLANIKSYFERQKTYPWNFFAKLQDKDEVKKVLGDYGDAAQDKILVSDEDSK